MAANKRTTSVSVISAEPNDELFGIEQRAHQVPWSKAVFFASTGRGYRWRQAVCANQVAGFTICQQIADELTLHNIAVDAASQRQGVGSALLLDVLDYADDNQLMVFLEVRQSNTAAIALYQRYGFSSVGRRPNYYPTAHGTEDAIVMRWSVEDSLCQ